MTAAIPGARCGGCWAAGENDFGIAWGPWARSGRPGDLTEGADSRDRDHEGQIGPFGERALPWRFLEKGNGWRNGDPDWPPIH